MIERPRYLAIISIITLLSASFLLVAPPSVKAAAQTIVVTTTKDDYPIPSTQDCSVQVPNDPSGKTCSLRKAIQLANATTGDTTTTIEFDIPKNDTGYHSESYLLQTVETWTIDITQPLDSIKRDGTIIDGFTQEDNIAGTQNTFGPTIIIDGASLQAVANSPGLTVQSSNNTIRGLAIVNFNYAGSLIGIGIEIRPNAQNSNPATGNTIQACYIGIDRLGATAEPNYYGIWVKTNNNLIGGSLADPKQRNVISGNSNNGILIDSTSGNKVQGNYVGLDRTGQTAVPNGGDGIGIRASYNTLVGVATTDTNTSKGNVISGNVLSGVHVFDGSNNQINGNLIGLTASGNEARPNATSTATSAETTAGVLIESANDVATGNTVGDTSRFTRNYISGNQKANIRLQGTKTTENTIINNVVGPQYGGTSSLLSITYAQDGVVLANGASKNRVGSTAINGPNYIAGNNGAGVRIYGYSSGPNSRITSDDNKILANYIGTDSSLNSPLSNTVGGVIISNYANRNQIGGPTDAERNYISFNIGNGIQIGPGFLPLYGTEVVSNTIYKNTITKNLGNGIYLYSAAQTVINGQDSTTPLRINDNTANGIYATGTNLITTTSSLTLTLQFSQINRNTQNGVLANNKASNVNISNSNIISNTLNGVRFSGAGNSQITSNTINENKTNGLLFDTAAVSVTISANSVLSNTLTGITVKDTDTKKIKITNNKISGNAVPSNTTYPTTANGNGAGIVLEPSGVPGGTATNPNTDIDPPQNLAIRQDGRLTGRVTSSGVGRCTNQSGNSVDGCVIEIFTTNSKTLDGQGLNRLTPSVTLTANGYFTASLGLIPAQIALTATDKDGNTSQFAVLTTRHELSITPTLSSAAVPGETVTYVHTVTNNGTIGYNDLFLSSTLQHPTWTSVVTPGGSFSLDPGQTRQVTMTVTLPFGDDSSVWVPQTERTRLTVQSTAIPAATASVTDTTTVGSKFLLSITPEQRQATTLPGSNALLVHTLKNNGNITATLNLDFGTDRPGWTTILTPSLPITLGPGQEQVITLSVFVPEDTLGLVNATTYVTVTNTVQGQGPDLTQVKYITDTVTAATKVDAYIDPESDTPKDGTTGFSVPFNHSVISNSTGAVTYKLTGYSTLGSTIRFIRTGGVDFDSTNNTFTLDGTKAGFQQLDFMVQVTVALNADPGDIDTIIIILSEAGENGSDVDAATDTIYVVRRGLLYNTWLPVTSNQR